MSVTKEDILYPSGKIVPLFSNDKLFLLILVYFNLGQIRTETYFDNEYN